MILVFGAKVWFAYTLVLFLPAGVTFLFLFSDKFWTIEPGKLIEGVELNDEVFSLQSPGPRPFVSMLKNLEI